MNVAPTPLHRRAARHPLALAVVVALVVVGASVLLLARYDVFAGSARLDSVRGSGVVATEPRAVAAFSGVELAGSNEVAIRVGGKQSVVVHADDNVLRHITTTVRDDRLVVGNTGGFTSAIPIRVDITVPSLDRLTLTGSGIVSAAGIHAATLTVTLSGSGVLRAGGSATRLSVTLAGSGDARLEHLVARDVRAVVSGSGRILVTATNSLSASVPGRGAITYGGDPSQVTTSITGTGAITRA
jgi:hypothetical protein